MIVASRVRWVGRWLRAFAAGMVFLVMDSPASAQSALELLRFNGVGGALIQGNVAKADFFADFSAFGGQVVERSNGDLDVDPTFWTGLETSYRLNPTVTLSGSWMHSRGRYRVTFPALSRDPGNFDLEGFILAAQDFSQLQVGGAKADRAMSDAVTDFYLLAATIEKPLSNRRYVPFATLGGGIFRQTSEGNVFRLEFRGSPPFGYSVSELLGGSVERDGFGLPLISVDQTNPVVSFGAGMRVSLGKKWSAEFRGEDLIRINPDLESLRGSVARPTEDESQRFFAVSVVPSDASMIHNIGFRFSLGYALWPFGAPR